MCVCVCVYVCVCAATSIWVSINFFRILNGQFALYQIYVNACASVCVFRFRQNNCYVYIYIYIYIYMCVCVCVCVCVRDNIYMMYECNLDFSIVCAFLWHSQCNKIRSKYLIIFEVSEHVDTFSVRSTLFWSVIFRSVFFLPKGRA